MAHKKKNKKSSLDDFEITKELGEGAFGLVYLATDKRSGREVAIKQIDMDKTLELKKVESVLREKDITMEL